MADDGRMKKVTVLSKFINKLMEHLMSVISLWHSLHNVDLFIIQQEIKFTNPIGEFW